jgi:hypothetical protein
MSLTAVLLALGLSLQAEAKLDYRNGDFIIRSNGATLRAVATPANDFDPRSDQGLNKPLNRIVFRKDDAFAVWDSRGLSVRKAGRLFSTRLPEIALTRKLFSVDEILTTRTLIFMQFRNPLADRLLGARRVGSKAYFLIGWTDASGQSWLEALVSVDLDAEQPRPSLVGRFPGRAARMSGDPNRLRLVDGAPSAIITDAEGRWGLSRLVGEEGAFDFAPLGSSLESVRIHSGGLGSFVEATPYGSRILGRFDLRHKAAKRLMETRGLPALLDLETPWLAIAHEEGGAWLHNLDSGAKLRLPEPCGLRRTKLGLLVWSPRINPTSATLFEVDRCEPIASWSAKR